MTKLEEVARAISIDLGEDPDALDVLIRGRDGKRPHWEGFESTARAAIEAMREPTEDMLDASWKLTGESREMRARVHASVRRHHAAMIDAILSNTKEGG